MFERWLKRWNPWNPWNPWNFGCGNFFRAKLPNWKAPKILRSKSAKSLRNMAMVLILETSIQFADFPAMFDETKGYLVLNYGLRSDDIAVALAVYH